MPDQASPDKDDAALNAFREQWHTVYLEAMAGLQEQTEERLSELQALIRRSQFQLIVNSPELC